MYGDTIYHDIDIIISLDIISDLNSTQVSNLSTGLWRTS